MSSDFNTLINFLNHFGPEVSGKVLMAPHSEAARKLERFATGACSSEERAEICELLKLHPAWLRWLADRVKMSRATSSAAH